MQKVLLSLLASLAVATPALAGETRVEARGGAIHSNGTTEDTWGMALGYDYDLAPGTFAGLEVSGDKIGQSGTKVAWGLSGRVGVKPAPGTKLYVSGGYTTKPCELCQHSWDAGAGIEQGIAGNFYVKGEYRHRFVGNALPDSDVFLGGVGIKF